MFGIKTKETAQYLFLITIIVFEIAAVVAALSIEKLFGATSYMLMTDLSVRAISIVLPLYLLASLAMRAYDHDTLANLWRSVSASQGAVFFAFAWFAIVAFLLKSGAEFSRFQMLNGAMSLAIFVFVIRLVAAWAVSQVTNAWAATEVHIFDGIEPSEIKGAIVYRAEELQADLDRTAPSMIAELGRIVIGKERVVVHCIDEHRASWAFMLRCLNVKSEIVTPELDFLCPLSIGSSRGHVSLVLASGRLTWTQRLHKRAFDLVAGILALLVFTPVLLATAIAIKIESPGPIFFRQERIGLANRRFQILKFRSMRADLEDSKASKLTARNDPRVTTVGKFIRKTSIDELPQLFNVIFGQMSIVGPRPHAEMALAGKSLYWEVDSAYWHRHVVKPGITGLAQIRGHRGNTFHEDDLRNRLQSDLEYVRDWTFWADIKIVMLTSFHVLNKNAF